MASTARYRPANTMADLSAEARALGRQSMAEFLVSPQVAKPAFQAAQDVRADAAQLATREAFETGEYADSFGVVAIPPVVIDGNPRSAFRVYNDDEAAPAVEYGNQRVGPGKRILRRAGEPYHSPKRPA